MGLFSSNKDKIEELSNQLSVEFEEKRKVYAELSDLKSQYDDLIHSVQELQKDKVHLEEIIIDLQKHIKNCSDVSENNGSEIVNVNVSLIDMNNKMIDLEKQFSDLSKQFEKVSSIYRNYTVALPIVHKLTSLEIWIKKLEDFISSKSGNINANKKEVDLASARLQSCRKGLLGENELKQHLIRLKETSPEFHNAVILQDLCFKSAFASENGYRKSIQIDFMFITEFVVFVFDSKYRTDVELIDEKSNISQNMQSYRKEIFEIIVTSGLAEKFSIRENNIYSIMVYSGKNEINHAGFQVKSTDINSGYCEECDEVQYIFADNFVDEISGIYSHSARKQLSVGLKPFSLECITEISDEILNYICSNPYDYNWKCPLCGRDIIKKSGFNGDFIGCTGFKNGCRYSESIK